MLAFLGVLPLLLATSATPIQKRDDSFYVTNSVIESGRDGSQCLIATKAEVGAPVTTGPCQGTPTDLLYWNLNEEGSGSLILTSTANSGSPLALDAGSSPENFGSVKLWTSYPGLYQQTWYNTLDERIAITGGNQCLDAGDNGPQTYQCTTDDSNQEWFILQTNA